MFPSLQAPGAYVLHVDESAAPVEDASAGADRGHRPATMQVPSMVPSSAQRDALLREARRQWSAWGSLVRDLRLGSETPKLLDALAAWQSRQQRHVEGLADLLRQNRYDLVAQALHQGSQVLDMTCALLNCDRAPTLLQSRERLMRRLDASGPLQLSGADDLGEFLRSAQSVIMMRSVDFRGPIDALDRMLDRAQRLPYPPGTQTSITVPAHAIQPGRAAYGPWPGMLVLGSGGGAVLLGTGHPVPAYPTPDPAAFNAEPPNQPARRSPDGPSSPARR